MTKARILADLLSDNAELADGQISVAEVVGAAPLANPTFTGTTSGTFSGPLTGNVTGNLTGDVTAPEIDLTAIAKDISDTAVDVFVYDTSKDSDGGAWRHRTQHTSWYNEAASATRGSRKEFPAVAVIVGEANEVTIYDGDDPDMPMWMVLPVANDAWLKHSGSGGLKALTALNGMLVTGGDIRGAIVNFIADNGDTFEVGYNYQQSGVINRNTSVGPATGSISIVNNTVNDVAMTVLPNSPIDAATGLPVPTIGIATNGGVSVIKDDGTVVDITRTTGNNTWQHVGIENNKIYMSSGLNGAGAFWVVDIPQADLGGYPIVTGGTLYGATSTPAILKYADNFIISKDNVVLASLTSGRSGLTYLQENLSAQGSVAYIASDYNTGYMVGDIKGAFLSDTDDTDVTATNLVVNGTFDSDTNWNKDGGWVISGGVASCSGSGASFIYPPSGAVSQDQNVIITLTITAYTSGNLSISSSTGGPTTAYMTATGTYTFFQTITGNASWYIRSDNFVGSIDNVAVYADEEDRSVNGNGLQVFGTVTKNPVATGADLVAYGPFTNANYLAQPYNSDLNFGTGDFCIMGWFKLDSNSGSSRIAYRQEDSTNRWSLYSNSSELWFYQTDGTALYAQMSGTHTLGNWHHVVVRRSNTLTDFALDGKIRANTSGHPGTAGARDATFNGELYLGRDPNESSGSTNSWNGSLALMRISATIPSPEQIAKIYEDEKHLFQEGAQATLYGSSDAVTALAYDDNTELLHVGTSAGRSVFQGLRRVDNTTDAVGAAISASNGLVAED